MRSRRTARLCISATVCSIRYSGTKNAGISSSGRFAIGAVLISPGALVDWGKHHIPGTVVLKQSQGGAPRSGKAKPGQDKARR